MATKKQRRKRAQEQQERQAATPKLGASTPVSTRLSDLLPRTLQKPPAASSGPPRAPSAGPERAPVKQPQPTPTPVPAARPRSPRTTAELAALNDAYRGVRPLATRAARSPRRGQDQEPRLKLPVGPRTQDDEQALARLGALVGEAERFELRLDDDGYVEARKLDAPRQALRELRSPAFRAEATLDLHGERAEAAANALDRFVRAQHRRGARRLLVITGKGQHSKDGIPVLGEVVRRALLRGGPAQLVQAFCSAHASLGGRGALCVLLRR
jgi:DNA-nicking Smr family endonuclease